MKDSWHVSTSVQPRYNLLFRSSNAICCRSARRKAIAVIPYNPLAGGLLTGKHNRTAPPAEGTRFTIGRAGAMYQSRYWHDKEFETVESLARSAREAKHEHDHARAALGAFKHGGHLADRRRVAAGAVEGRSCRRRRGAVAGRLKARLDEMTDAYRAIAADR